MGGEGRWKSVTSSKCLVILRNPVRGSEFSCRLTRIATHGTSQPFAVLLTALRGSNARPLGVPFKIARASQTPGKHKPPLESEGLTERGIRLRRANKIRESLTPPSPFSEKGEGARLAIPGSLSKLSDDTRIFNIECGYCSQIHTNPRSSRLGGDVGKGRKVAECR